MSYSQNNQSVEQVGNHLSHSFECEQVRNEKIIAPVEESKYTIWKRVFYESFKLFIKAPNK